MLIQVFDFRRLVWLALLVLYLTVVSTQAQYPTIAQAYAQTDAGKLVQLSGKPAIVVGSYTNGASPSQTVMEFGSTFPFDCDGPGGNMSCGFYVPTRVTMVYPWCANAAPIITQDAPCGPGLLYYGYQSLPFFDGPIPDNSTILNGPVAMAQIVGSIIPATDIGTGPYYGTLTYFPACPNTTLSFLVQISAFGMYNIGDPTPVEYCDSQSGTCLWATHYGFGCTSSSRSATTPIYTPAPAVIPICRASTAANAPGLSPALVTEVFGSGFIGPTNLNPGAVVYMIRVDNLAPTVYIQFHIVLVYPNGVNTTINMQTEFNTVYYFASSGSTPALVYVCYYNSATCQITAPIFNEAQLGYLDLCNCGPTPTTANVVCNATAVVIGSPIARSSIPYFSNPAGFQATPSCGIVIGTGVANSTTPVVAVPFTFVSGAFGGIPPLTYAWRFVHAPQSAALLQEPTTSSSVLATVYAPGSYTIEHTVTGNNGFSTTCDLSFAVEPGQPTACYNPPGNLVYMAVGEVINYDATCSFNPIGTPLNYRWTSTSFYNTTGLPFSLSTNVGPTMFVTGIFPGSGLIFLNVTNEVTTAWKTIYIYVQPMVTPGSAPYAPFSVPLPPTTQCIVPAPPTYIPWLQPSNMPPLSHLPVAPQAPGTLNPSGSSPWGGLLPPSAYIEPWVVTTAGFLVVIVFVFVILVGVIAPAVRRRPRTENDVNVDETAITVSITNRRNPWYRG